VLLKTSVEGYVKNKHQSPPHNFILFYIFTEKFYFFINWGKLIMSGGFNLARDTIVGH